MTTLALNVSRTYEIGPINALPVIAGDIIYEGAAVGDNGSGYARPLQAGDPFRGFAKRNANNSDGAAGAIRVELMSEGWIVLTISGLAITDVGKDVYASDDDTFTLTQGSNTRIGYVYRWETTGRGVVRFSANHGTISEIAAISGGESPTEAEHNAVITAVNALIRRLGG